MRLLEMIYGVMIALSLTLTAPYLQAQNRCDMNDFSNPGIIVCSQESFDKVDRILNEQYKFLVNEMPAQQVENLKSAQRYWITFKESYCNEVYDGIFPGQEAPIDKLSCLQQATSFRLSELLYLRAGVIADGFHKAVAVISQKNMNPNFQKVVEFLAGQRELGESWLNYATQNCMMVQALYQEKFSMCMARMRFQTPTN